MIEEPKTQEALIQEEIKGLKDDVEAYAFFSNQVKVNITLYNGLHEILKAIKTLEEKIDRLEKSNENKQ